MGEGRCINEGRRKTRRETITVLIGQGGHVIMYRRENERGDLFEDSIKRNTKRDSFLTVPSGK